MLHEGTEGSIGASVVNTRFVGGSVGSGSGIGSVYLTKPGSFLSV